jgi:hypothetical protein
LNWYDPGNLEGIYLFGAKNSTAQYIIWYEKYHMYMCLFYITFNSNCGLFKSGGVLIGFLILTTQAKIVIFGVMMASELELI